jgi:hypothetical protein
MRSPADSIGHPGLEANSAPFNNGLDGMEGVWKAAGKRPYETTVGIEN